MESLSFDKIPQKEIVFQEFRKSNHCDLFEGDKREAGLPLRILFEPKLRDRSVQYKFWETLMFAWDKRFFYSYVRVEIVSKLVDHKILMSFIKLADKKCRAQTLLLYFQDFNTAEIQEVVSGSPVSNISIDFSEFEIELCDLLEKARTPVRLLQLRNATGKDIILFTNGPAFDLVKIEAEVLVSSQEEWDLVRSSCGKMQMRNPRLNFTLKLKQPESDVSPKYVELKSLSSEDLIFTHDCYFSYERNPSDKVTGLITALKKRLPTLKVWDSKDGKNREMIESCSAFVCFVTEKYLHQGNDVNSLVAKEVHYAQRLGIEFMIVIVLDRVLVNDDSAWSGYNLTFHLNKTLYLNFTTVKSFHEEYAKFVNKLETVKKLAHVRGKRGMDKFNEKRHQTLCSEV